MDILRNLSSDRHHVGLQSRLTHHVRRRFAWEIIRNAPNVFFQKTLASEGARALDRTPPPAQDLFA